MTSFVKRRLSASWNSEVCGVRCMPPTSNLRRPSVTASPNTFHASRS
jgi:hypothetical protein